MSLTAEQRTKLGPILTDVAGASEELVRTGLTAATTATTDRLTHAANEITRLGLGRLAASMRFAVEEVGRYLASSEEFSRQRLALFLHRTWTVAHGLQRAIHLGDEALLARLLAAPTAPQV